MRRGTTPTLTFTTPYDADQVQDGYITIVQGCLTIEHALADACGASFLAKIESVRGYLNFYIDRAF